MPSVCHFYLPKILSIFIPINYQIIPESFFDVPIIPEIILHIPIEEWAKYAFEISNYFF